MNFYNIFVLICLLNYLRLNKQSVKQFYDNIIYSPLRINIHLKMQNTKL